METTYAPGRLWHRGMLVDVLLDAGATGGAFALLDVRVARGAGAPHDLHEHEDQALHVLEGELEVRVGGELHRLGPGRSIDLPRGIPHGFTAASDEARLLLTCVPAGFEGFVRAASVPALRGAGPDAPLAAAVDEDDLAALRAVAGLRELPL